MSYDCLIEWSSYLNLCRDCVEKNTSISTWTIYIIYGENAIGESTAQKYLNDSPRLGRSNGNNQN